MYPTTIYNSLYQSKFILGDWISGLFLCLFGTVMFFNAFILYRRKRKMEDMPTSLIRSVAVGLAEIKGKALPETALLSPVTKTPCCYYKYCVQEQRGKEKKWHTIHSGDSSQTLFFLEDEPDTLRVNPYRCELLTDHFYQTDNSGWNTTLPEHIISFLNAVGISDKSLFFNRTLRIQEWIIPQGAQLLIMGNVKPINISRKATMDLLREKLRELKQKPELLKKLDKNQDGSISSAEWEIARIRVEEWAQRQQTAGKPLLEIGFDHQFGMIISDKPEQLVLRNKTYQIAMGLIGGPLLFLVGLGIAIF